MENNKKSVSEILDIYLSGNNGAENAQEHRMQLRLENIKNRTTLGDGIAKALEAEGVKVNRATNKNQNTQPPRPPRVSEYAAAETYNALHGGAPDNVIAERLKICGGCEFRSTTYKGATDPDNFGWCTKCGCGNNPRALLVTKARLAQVSCPLTPPRWEKVEGVGGSVASVVDSVKGVAQSIKHLLTGKDEAKQN